MKALGVIGIIAGALMVFIGARFVFVSPVIALPPMLIGLIAILCGAICISLDNVYTRLRAMDEKLARTEQMIRSQQPTAEQMVDELRQEGLIRSGPATVTDEDIDEMLE